MTSIPSNNTEDWLDEILNHVYLEGVVENDKYITVKEAKAAILAKINEIIGEDEKQRWDDEDGFCQTCDFTRSDDSKECICVLHNNLRAEQRTRAGIKVEEK